MKKIVALVLAGSLVASGGCGERDPEGLTAPEAKEIADRWMTDNLPQVRLNRLRAETSDMGKAWRVDYRAPEGGTGGVLVLIIDKRTGEIVGGRMDQ